jgi:zinc/manganese transport system substrate-binding protein
MFNRRNVVTLLVGTALFTAPVAALTALPAFAQDRLPVVATFSILGDFVGQVGGDRIDLTTLVGPDGDGHVYSPTPTDARRVAQAKVVFTNGLDFEGWIDRLIASSGTTAKVVVASEGIDTIAEEEGEEEHGHAGAHAHGHGHAHAPGPDHGKKEERAHGHSHGHAHGHSHGHNHGKKDERAHGHAHGASHSKAESPAGHEHGEFDPHAWQDIDNVKIYVANIRDALIEVDPEGSETYTANAARYLDELNVLEAEVEAAIASVPEGNRKVITTHDSFAYFSRAYGLTFIAPQGVSTESEASARDVAEIIRQIREQDIKAVFIENISDPRLIERIAAETKAVVGGTLYSDALSPADGPAGTYIDMMRHNISVLSEALGS